MMKQHIYSRKCFKEIPIFMDFMYKMSMWYQTEKQLASDKGKMNVFKKKWKNFF